MTNRYAYIIDGFVREIVVPPEGLDLSDCRHIESPEQYVSCGPEIDQGWMYDGEEFSPPEAIAPPDLAMVKKYQCDVVDARAETERLKYITPGSGQAMTYQQKADEARRFVAAEAPVAADYPMLSGEVGVTADDIAGVAAVVKAAHEGWQVIGAAIEGVRLRAKKAINQAATVEDAEAAAGAVAWPQV